MPPMALRGVVTKAGYMNKTVTVTVPRYMTHKITGKLIERSKKYLIHDETNQLKEEDSVIIRNCPPISAKKRFTLDRIIDSPETAREIVRQRRKTQTKAQQPEHRPLTSS